jgi:hypothetical protein
MLILKRTSPAMLMIDWDRDPFLAQVEKSRPTI